MMKIYKVLIVFYLFLVQASVIAAEPLQIKVLQDQFYGIHKSQAMDIYLPSYPVNAKDQLAILMLHSGTDKADPIIVNHKVKRWVTDGVLFASANYRLSPFAKPMTQVRDVAKALALFQRKLTSWGGNPSKVIVMGHATGGYLASLLTTTPHIVKEEGVSPWLGTIAIDSITLDVVSIMEKNRSTEYENIFGKDLTYWRTVSPLHQLKEVQYPLLLVCSTTQSKENCSSADEMKYTGEQIGAEIDTLRVRLDHKELSNELGKDNDYTLAVEQFIAKLYRGENKD